MPKSDLPAVATSQALVIPVSGHETAYALQVAREARASGMRTEVDVSGHGVGAGLKSASKRQMRLALIVGEEEQRQGMVTVRDLVTGEEQIAQIATVAERVQREEQFL